MQKIIPVNEQVNAEILSVPYLHSQLLTMYKSHDPCGSTSIVNKESTNEV
jgi:hypothetical protein